jgi:hypothetical protein
MTATAGGHPSSPLPTTSVSGREDAKDVVKIAREQLSELLQRRAVIVKRITTLRRMLNCLVEIFGDKILSDELKVLINGPLRTRVSGLTAACRSVLLSSSHPLAAGQVVARIRSTDDTLLQNHKNAVASVTTILCRLQSYGETAVSTNPSGKRVWMWIR